jgi:hypothetical protein
MKAMEGDMSPHNPIGACCSRPRFNPVGGIDDSAVAFVSIGVSMAKEETLSTASKTPPGKMIRNLVAAVRRRSPQ